MESLANPPENVVPQSGEQDPNAEQNGVDRPHHTPTTQNIAEGEKPAALGDVVNLELGGIRRRTTNIVTVATR